MVQYAPLKITCKYELGSFRVNTASFLFNHNAQHNASTPTNICFLSFSTTRNMLIYDDFLMTRLSFVTEHVLIRDEIFIFVMM